MGEVFVAGAEKAEFPGFRILGPVKTAPFGDDHGSRNIRTDHGRSQEGERVYTGPRPGAKMGIPVKMSSTCCSLYGMWRQIAPDTAPTRRSGAAHNKGRS